MTLTALARQEASLAERPIRRMVADDIPWLAGVVKGFYGGIVDWDRCEAYYRATIDRPDHVYLRGEMSAGAAKAYLPFWAPKDSRPIASDVFFCPAKTYRALPELVLLMREMVRWADERGCCQMSFAALNGADIANLAKKAGADDPVPVFRAVF